MSEKRKPSVFYLGSQPQKGQNHTCFKYLAALEYCEKGAAEAWVGIEITVLLATLAKSKIFPDI